MSCLSNLMDGLKEQDNETAHALADSIRDLIREVGMQKDRVSTAAACSEACHALTSLMLGIEHENDDEAQASYLERTTAKERAEMVIADLSC